MKKYEENPTLLEWTLWAVLVLVLVVGLAVGFRGCLTS